MKYKTSIISIFAIIAAAGTFSATAASETTTSINKTPGHVLFDGKCSDSEWQGATKIPLPAETALYLMHNEHSLFVCATGKSEDYTVIDIYIEDPKTGLLHDLHASAQLSERVFKDNKWSDPARWQLQDWGGFWVPYAG